MFSLSTKFSLGSEQVGVLFVDLPKAWAIGRLAERLYNREREALLNCSTVVVRLAVDEQLDNASVLKKEWQPLLERLPKQSVFALHSENFRHALTRITPERSNDLIQTTPDLIAHLRDEELTHFAKNSNAILQLDGSSILRLPSKQFSQHFMRVGNIQTSKPALDAVFFWMLPWLHECGTIITETWTISSISLNASRLLARYTGTPPCRVDMMSQYHDGSTEVLDQLEAALERAAGQQGRTLFLISACMSGNLEAMCRATVSRILGDESRISFLAIYRLFKETAIDHLCDLGKLGMSFKTPAEVDLRGRTVIEIDRRTYFPVHQVDRPVRIKQEKAMWQHGRDALAAYRNSGLVSCHRDSFDLYGQRIRHHAVYFAIEKILDTERFRMRLQDYLSKIRPSPDLIIVPPHPAGAMFADHVAHEIEATMGVKPPIFVERDLVGPREAELSKILSQHQSENSVLLLDDVSISGERLGTYQRDFRRIGYAGRIHYLVAVARPESPADWNDRKIQLSYRDSHHKDDFNTVTAIETVLMPDWDGSDCPWCREEGLLRRVSSRITPIPDFVQQRLKTLQRRDGRSPLVNELFLEIDPDDPMKISQNSIFLPAPATQADAVAAVAHKLAMMRCEIGVNGLRSSGFPVRAILNHNCYLGNWFNDSVIRAAILRMTTRREIEYSRFDGEENRKKRMKEIVLSGDTKKRDLTLELALGIAFRNLPPVEFSDREMSVMEGAEIAKTFKLLSTALEASF